jgi:hypothetical protein
VTGNDVVAHCVATSIAVVALGVSLVAAFTPAPGGMSVRSYEARIERLTTMFSEASRDHRAALEDARFYKNLYQASETASRVATGVAERCLAREKCREISENNQGVACVTDPN